MSMIVRMMEAMDSLLEANPYPQHFILDNEEWAEIRARFGAEGSETGVIDGDTYRGVPVQFGRYDKAGTIGLMSLNQVTVSD